MKETERERKIEGEGRKIKQVKQRNKCEMFSGSIRVLPAHPIRPRT